MKHLGISTQRVYNLVLIPIKICRNHTSKGIEQESDLVFLALHPKCRSSRGVRG